MVLDEVENKRAWKMLEILMSQINFFVINVMPFRGGVEVEKYKKKVAISLIFVWWRERIKKGQQHQLDKSRQRAENTKKE